MKRDLNQHLFKHCQSKYCPFKSSIIQTIAGLPYKENEPIETTHKHKENNLHHNDGNITN